ncbi:MAG TPA: ATP-binding cassette domain-containing protein [Candidatus Limnocylindrales bacterium]|jgi:simple sugar transport system ATP-binding protein|nr:ATP-binding cassette domain-containing protein [Candidatus Limnocylindrales bacterium]
MATTNGSGIPTSKDRPATAAAGVPAIRATGIVKRYGHLHALRGASIDLHPGEIVALVGDNGAGKSTLTKVICGAVPADEGEISFWGEPTRVQSIHHAHQLGVHTVYQDLALAPHLSVADNLFLGREQIPTGWRSWIGVLDRKSMVEETKEAMGRLGIALRDYTTPVGNLSGGQRQALAVARAITWATTAVLMDEPTAALGPKQSAIVYQTVTAAADRGLAVLVISHDIPRMLEVAHRIAVMRHGTVVAVREASSLRLQDVIGLMLGDEVAA